MGRTIHRIYTCIIMYYITLYYNLFKYAYKCVYIYIYVLYIYIYEDTVVFEGKLMPKNGGKRQWFILLLQSKPRGS